MNNKYNDLKSIQKWAKLYWIFFALFALFVVGTIALLLTPMMRDFLNYVTTTPGMTLNKATTEFERLVTANQNNRFMYIVFGLALSVFGLGITVATIVSVVQIISFNGKYNDPKYKSMFYSLFVLLIGMVPLFYIFVSYSTRQSVIEEEKDATVAQ